MMWFFLFTTGGMIRVQQLTELEEVIEYTELAAC